MRALLLALAMAMPIAHAADVDPARLAEARAIVKAMELDKQLDQMVGVMSQALSQRLAQAGGVAGSNPRVTQVIVGESMAMSRENAVRPGGLIDTVIQVYAEKFTLDELRQIRAFHETPVAKKLQDTTPELMQRVIQQSMIRNKEMLPGLCARVKRRLQEEKLPEGETFGCPAVWS
jgi:uncharacterized protein